MTFVVIDLFLKGPSLDPGILTLSSTMALEIVHQYYAQYDAVAAPIGAAILSWAKPEGWVLNVTKVSFQHNLPQFDSISNHMFAIPDLL